MENAHAGHRVKFIVLHLALVIFINLGLLAISLDDQARFALLVATNIFPLVLLLGEDAAKPGRKATFIASSILAGVMSFAVLACFWILLLRSAYFGG